MELLHKTGVQKEKKNNKIKHFKQGHRFGNHTLVVHQEKEGLLWVQL